MSKPTLLQVAQTVIAAFFGVQNDKNRERDFQHGSAPMYIIAGLIGTILFVFIIIFIVSTII